MCPPIVRLLFTLSILLLQSIRLYVSMSVLEVRFNSCLSSTCNLGFRLVQLREPAAVRRVHMYSELGLEPDGENGIKVESLHLVLCGFSINMDGHAHLAPLERLAKQLPTNGFHRAEKTDESVLRLVEEQKWFESTSKRAKSPKAGSEPDFEIKVQESAKKCSRVPVPKRMGELGLSVHRSGGSICYGVVRRGVAQVSASVLGTEGHRFRSCHLDVRHSVSKYSNKAKADAVLGSSFSNSSSQGGATKLMNFCEPEAASARSEMETETEIMRLFDQQPNSSPCQQPNFSETISSGTNLTYLMDQILYFLITLTV
ncbi:hypothetical protein L2E82_35868 [Cichorium intybus]|uniref:Uncharacterized protein n=1 Tax=Cichorium intybus TaxID=13427 RepID=A0ACB9BQ31_CICIN|nr:hypothetical protein L2E82_35868 [Cichorium intybus]